MQQNLLKIKDKCSLIIKKRPTWGSESFIRSLSSSINASISIRTLEQEASDSSISIFFSQSSTGMLEAINSGSLVILCLDLENHKTINKSFGGRGLVRDPSEYCLVIDIEYLNLYVNMLRENTNFLEDIFEMQNFKLKKDFKSNEF